MRLIVAMTGASGAIYGIKLLEKLQKQQIETHLVVSKWAETTITTETGYSLAALRDLATQVHEINDLTASIASGSFLTDGMVVVPCSMKTLAGIAHGYSEDLITRAADVTLKERRRLILVARETPLSPIHLENMLKLSRLGVTIMPPMPAFYSRPQSVEEIVNQTVGRILDQLHLKTPQLYRWTEK